MACVVVQHPVVHSVLEVEFEGWVLTQIEQHIVLKGHRLGPNGSACARRGEDNRYVLEQQAVYARCALAGIKSKRVACVHEFNRHAEVGHVSDVHATAIAHGANGQRQRSSNAA